MKQITKAIAAAVGAFGTGLVSAATAGDVTTNAWLVILGGTLIAGAATYQLPNADAE